MRYIAALCGIVLLTGCVSNPGYQYDPNEQILHGVVLAKQAITDPNQLLAMENEAARQRNALVLQQAQVIGAGAVETLGAILIINMLGLPAGDVTLQGLPTAYTVNTTEGRTVQVLSHYSGFTTGQCVKLFISPDVERYPPRMAHGFECAPKA